MPALTIGLPTHTDYNGVYFTLQALRLYHADVLDQCEILIVDNAPKVNEGAGTVEALAKRAGVRYVPFPDPVGPACAKNQVFAEAKGDAVLCMDSHVLLPPGTLARLLRWYADNPTTQDLYQGPVLDDALNVMATHFDDTWSGEMWGQWSLDKRGDPRCAEYREEPFEILAQGMGLFTCRREAWLGFNPAFRGFGAEERYIHEKYRQAGRRCWCLPWLRWAHRFGHPGGIPYPLMRWHKARNYVIGLTELGIPLDGVRDHFKLTERQWAIMTANPSNPPLSENPKDLCQTCHERAQAVAAAQATATPEMQPARKVTRLQTVEDVHAELSRPTLGPGILRKALNAGKAMVKAVAAGLPMVDDATFKVRLDGCLACPHRAGSECLKCGCVVQWKASLATEDCPDEPARWAGTPAIPGQERQDTPAEAHV